MSNSAQEVASEEKIEISIVKPQINHHSESELSATGLQWDSHNNKWISDEEASAVESNTSTKLEIPVEDDVLEKEATIWVDWNGADDPENPYNFSTFKKWQTTVIVCLLTLNVAFIGSSFAIGQTSMSNDLNSSDELSTLGLSIFPLAFGLAPLILAPFSEAYGRYLMYVGSSLTLLIALFPTAFAPNIATVIVFRFLGGGAASTGSSLAGGTVADLFPAASRGKPMSFFSICAFGGTSLGVVVGGFLEQYLNHGWRFIQWLQIIMTFVILVLTVFFTEETRGSVILSRRAAKLRKDTGSNLYQCRTDAEKSSLLVLMKVSMTRPLYLLATEPIVMSFSIWIALGWGILYLTLEAVPLVMSSVYGFNAVEVGLVFLSGVLASFIGFGANFYQEYLYTKNFPIRNAEARLYLARVAGLTLPLGIFIFGFGQGRTHWIVPVIGLTIVFESIFAIYLAVFVYLADTYTIYSSSALAGQSLARNLFGFAFPLFTKQMYDKMGFQWASFLSGMLALVLGVTPFVLMAYGPRIRAASKFSQKLEKI